MQLKWYLYYKDVRKTKLIGLLAVHRSRTLKDGYPTACVPVARITVNKDNEVTDLALEAGELYLNTLSPNDLHRRAKPVVVHQEDVIRAHWGMAKWAWPELDNPLRLEWNTYNPDAIS